MTGSPWTALSAWAASLITAESVDLPAVRLKGCNPPLWVARAPGIRLRLLSRDPALSFSTRNPNAHATRDPARFHARHGAETPTQRLGCHHPSMPPVNSLSRFSSRSTNCTSHMFP